MTPDEPKLSRAALVALFPLTVLTMLPVTGVVPVLKPLIQDHYAVGELSTSLFMSINMLGALAAAPLLGWWSDRTGASRTILLACALTDGLLWWLLSTRPAFPVLMTLRLLEGAAHIGVLTMLMAMMSGVSVGPRRSARMAGMGGAIIFGVALGAPLGGILGRHDVLLPLRLGVGIMLAVALTALLVLPGRREYQAGATEKRWPPLRVARQLWLPYLFGFIDRFTVGIFVIAFVLYAARHGYGPRRTGLFIGAFMMTFTALSYPAGRLAERIGLWPVLLVGTAGYAVAYSAIAWTTGWALWPLMVLCGMVSALMFGPNLMLLVRGSTAESRGVAMAGFNTAGSLGFLIGPLLAGSALQGLRPALGEATAFRVLFAATGGLVLLCVLIGIWRLRRQKDQP
ncbi:MAG: MFS transporter [bacterium]